MLCPFIISRLPFPLPSAGSPTDPLACAVPSRPIMLATQKQCCRNPCHTFSSERPAAGGGGEGKTGLLPGLKDCEMGRDEAGHTSRSVGELAERRGKGMHSSCAATQTTYGKENEVLRAHLHSILQQFTASARGTWNRSAIDIAVLLY